MKKTKSSNLTLTAAAPDTGRLTGADRIAISLITLLMSLGCALVLAALFAAPVLLPIGIAVACSAAAVLLQCGRWRAWCLPGCLLLAVVLGLVLLTPLRQSLAAAANQVLYWYEGRRSRVYLTYTGGAAGQIWPLLLVLLPPVAGLSAWASAGARRWPLLLALLPPVACAVGLLPVGVGLLLLAGGCGLQLVYCVRRDAGENGKTLALQLAACLAACLAALLLALACGNALENTSSQWRQRLENWAHAVRYDTASNAMPEGQLYNLPAWEPDDTAALEVTMDEPQKLYLRGFVGQTYTGQSWQDLPAETRADSADLFYWLHQSNFYGQSVLASAYQALEETASAKITIKNLTACKKQYFLPYAADTAALADDRQIGDSAVLAKNDTYTAYYYPGSIPEWFTLQNDLADAAESTLLKRYQVSEAAYRDYAETNDLEIPDEVRSLLAQELGSASGGMTLSQIKDTILTYLDSNMTYQPGRQTENGDTDFILYTLRESPYGYSVHYATIATMMLRYYGIPARYCEGYYVSGDEAATYAAGQTVTFTEAKSHAWTEYYLAGVGWLPFEVTPGYVDKEELEGEGLGGGGRTYMPPQHQPEETPEENPTDENRTVPVFRVWWLLAALGCLLLVLAALLAARRLRLRRRLAEIAAAEDKAAIALRFAYAAWLMGYAGATPENLAAAGLDYAAARRLQLEALYSQHTMDPAQRQWMDDYAAQVLAHCQNRWKRLQRWYYHWIKCLY